MIFNGTKRCAVNKISIPIENAEYAVYQAYKNGFLGKNILGSDFSFDVEVSLTGDSYVAGEETALLVDFMSMRFLERNSS